MDKLDYYCNEILLLLSKDSSKWFENNVIKKDLNLDSDIFLACMVRMDKKYVTFTNTHTSILSSGYAFIKLQGGYGKQSQLDRLQEEKLTEEINDLPKVKSNRDKILIWTIIGIILSTLISILIARHVI